MFEVGKKYTYKSKTAIEDPRIYECVFVGKMRAMLRIGTYEYDVTLMTDNYVEYREPKVEKVKRFVRSYNGDIYTNKSLPPPDYTETKVLGQIEFTLTDGKLTDVKIIES